MNVTPIELMLAIASAGGAGVGIGGIVFVVWTDLGRRRDRRQPPVRPIPRPAAIDALSAKLKTSADALAAAITATETPKPKQAARSEPTPKSSAIVVPRPTWFEVDPSDDGRQIEIKLTMTKGEVAAANMEFASIGPRPALAVFRNALQMALKVMR